MNSLTTAPISFPSGRRLCIRQAGVRGRKMALAIDRCKSSKSALDRTSRNFAFELLFLELESFERFMVDFVKGGDAVVPLEQSGRVADLTYRVPVHLPDRIQDGMIMGIENVFFEFGVAGNVDLADAVVWDVVEIVVRIEIVVLGRDIDVINIEENSTIGQFDDFTQELP